MLHKKNTLRDALILLLIASNSMYSQDSKAVTKMSSAQKNPLETQETLDSLTKMLEHRDAELRRASDLRDAAHESGIMRDKKIRYLEETYNQLHEKHTDLTSAYNKIKPTSGQVFRKRSLLSLALVIVHVASYRWGLFGGYGKIKDRMEGFWQDESQPKTTPTNQEKK